MEVQARTVQRSGAAQRGAPPRMLESQVITIASENIVCISRMSKFSLADNLRNLKLTVENRMDAFFFFF